MIVSGADVYMMDHEDDPGARELMQKELAEVEGMLSRIADLVYPGMTPDEGHRQLMTYPVMRVLSQACFERASKLRKDLGSGDGW